MISFVIFKAHNAQRVYEHLMTTTARTHQLVPTIRTQNISTTIIHTLYQKSMNPSHIVSNSCKCNISLTCFVVFIHDNYTLNAR